MDTKFLASLIPAIAFSAVAFLCSCSSDGSSGVCDPTPKDGKFADCRDGQVYKYVTINEQTWMAENLNYAAVGSRCGTGDGVLAESGGNGIGKNTSYCDDYGRLYSWATVMDVGNE